MNKSINQITTSSPESKNIFNEFIIALEEEIETIKKNGLSSTLLNSGRKIESNNGEFWYRFSVEYAPSLPSDTPCTLLIGKDQFDVTVVSFEDDSIIISSKSPLPETIATARLDNGSAVLMERLIKCIEENSEKENYVGRRMFPLDGIPYTGKSIFSYNGYDSENDNTEKQNLAVKTAIENDITYIWGPPGTGKTKVIGQIINELYKHGRSVLVVSHTNTAVDGAIENVHKTIFGNTEIDIKNYPILRIGVPSRHLPESVLLKNHISALGKDLYDEKESLELNKSEIQMRINDILPFLAKEFWIRETTLPIISKFLQELSILEKQIDVLQEESNKVQYLIDNEKTTHPEYAKFGVLSKKYNAKKLECSELNIKLTNMENLVKEIPEHILFARDEIKKHTKYSELQKKESQLMSENFIRGELSIIVGKINTIKKEIQSLKKDSQSVQLVITDYGRKNTVAKFFSGKGILEHAQIRFNEINMKISQLEEELQQKHKLELNYQAQLDELLFLQEQMKIITPSKTTEYWENQIEKLLQQLTEIEPNLPEIRLKKEVASQELEILEQSFESAKSSFSNLRILKSKLNSIQSELEDVNGSARDKNKDCDKYLKQECSICSKFFYSVESTSKEDIFDELSSLMSNVRTELQYSDINSLKVEKEFLENNLADIYMRLKQINQKIQELEKQAIINAKIVGTTLAKSYLSDSLRERTFDTVILDEASMASIPALWCASYLAEKSVVIVGDFLQLPPIVISDSQMAKKWLGKDIFFHSGMQEIISKVPPKNFIMLNDQFRMESEIADIANMYYGEYGGLISEDSRLASREKFYSPDSFYSVKRTEHCVHLIDTESLHAWVTGVPQGKSHSRMNCFSAAVDVDLAFSFLNIPPPSGDLNPVKEASVLIVAPYRPHVARINKLIDLEYKNRGFPENLNYIRAGTIHSFQGSEADIVIFDLVIDEPHWKANLFMNDKEVNDNLRKMFNVAITRAKYKLYIVGNFSYCQKRAKNNALSELLDKLILDKKLIKEDVRELLPDIAFSGRRDSFAFDLTQSKHIVCREESFNDKFISDISYFKKRLIIYSPFITENRLSVLLPYFVDAISHGKQIVVVTKAPSDRGKSEIAQYQKCEKELANIGVNLIHKKGMHEKLIFVDNEAIWIGSLNALSFTGFTGEVMHRFMDKELTEEYEKLFEIDHICKSVQNLCELKCPICGEEMIIKESKSGGIYWECIKKDYSRSTNHQYPVDGILRCKCGASYIFSMKSQPRWICSKNPSHYQLMRESDLKLENMAALIPTKNARREVDQFFDKKRKKRDTANSKNTTKNSNTAENPCQLTIF